MDQQQLQAEFDLKKQLATAQIGALKQKTNYLDVDKLGEQALFKAAMGGELSPAETAAARYADAKSGGIQFDPVTGGIMQKPSIGSKLGLSLGGGAPAQPVMGGGGMMPNIPNTAPGGNQLPIDPSNEYDLEFQRVYDAAQGNPRLQQTLMADYSKSKYDMNESQAKAAGFADRMVANEPVLTDQNNVEALASPYERFKAAVPLVGNYLVSDQYQSGEQAQRDFLNSVLRRESGAVIGPSEFASGKKQYFPQPGDSEAVLAQKARNRETALAGVQRSAGPAYKKPETISSPVSAPASNGNGDAGALEELRRRGIIR